MLPVQDRNEIRNRIKGPLPFIFGPNDLSLRIPDARHGPNPCQKLPVGYGPGEVPICPGLESVGWFGILAPGSTPPDVIAKLNAAFTKTLKDPAVIKQIRAVGAEPAPMTSAEFSAFIDKEIVKWSAVMNGLAQKPN